jgi:Protein of unknown function (DUF4242)
MTVPPSEQATPAAFVVEHYWPGITPERFRPAADRLRRSSNAAAALGSVVRLLHSTVVTQDDTAFCVFEAESQEAVRQVYSRAGVRFERLLDAFEIDFGEAATTTEEAR